MYHDPHSHRPHSREPTVTTHLDLGPPKPTNRDRAHVLTRSRRRKRRRRKGRVFYSKKWWGNRTTRMRRRKMSHRLAPKSVPNEPGMCCLASGQEVRVGKLQDLHCPPIAPVAKQHLKPCHLKTRKRTPRLRPAWCKDIVQANRCVLVCHEANSVDLTIISQGALAYEALVELLLSYHHH